MFYFNWELRKSQILKDNIIIVKVLLNTLSYINHNGVFTRSNIALIFILGIFFLSHKFIEQNQPSKCRNS